MASTERNGTKYAQPSQSRGPVGNAASVAIGVTLAGAGLNPTPHYLLACIDSVGARHYWTDTSVSMNAAPSLGGGATYNTATLVVEGRF